jgi:deazaflavin-dependent oxidoreductase (nitroreductase family)
VSAGLVAFPMIVLGTTGARTGKKRKTPLAAIPVGDDLGLIASNAGSGTIPGWAHNLQANPEATVTYGRRLAAVVARTVHGDEYDQVFAAAERVYTGFAGYRERVDYTIPVFMLTAIEETHPI